MELQLVAVRAPERITHSGLHPMAALRTQFEGLRIGLPVRPIDPVLDLQSRRALGSPLVEVRGVDRHRGCAGEIGRASCRERVWVSEGAGRVEKTMSREE